MCSSHHNLASAALIGAGSTPGGDSSVGGPGPIRPGSTALSPELAACREQIEAVARSYGLNFFDVIYEVLPFDMMNQIAAYGGFPVRYPHWKWGMEYEKLSKRDAYGLGRIYEMVINTNPVYAYLQESNTVTDQKLVMAHVYGHADFFKNNFWFGQTNRKMLDEMANHATRIRRYADRYGVETVERFLDACLSVEGLIDPYTVYMSRAASGDPGSNIAGGSDGADEGEALWRGPDHATAAAAEKLPAKDYMDRFINPPEQIDKRLREHAEAAKRAREKLPSRPLRDVLAFVLRFGRLESWQQDILSMVRDEAYYFAPQAMTKIMNEGWASYWHSHMMTHHFCQASEVIHYCDQHAGVMHMPAGGFNPYKIGIELYKDIERRWNTGQHGPAWENLDSLGAKERYNDNSNQGRAKIFEVRRIYNDVTFIEEFLTPEFVERLGLFQTNRDENTGEVRVASRDFHRVKQTLLHFLTNRGEPFIYAVDGNYLNRGELYLAHQFAGVELDAAKAEQVLANMRLLWGRPVHLQMRFRDDMFLFSCDQPGDTVRRERISDETPAPAHILT